MRNISSQQQNRAFLNKRLTLTLLLVSTISLLLWLSLVIANCLIYILKVNIPKVYLFSYIIVLLNFFNSLVNPAVYSLRRPLRIPEFRQALGFCIIRRRKLINRDERNKGRDNRGFTPTPAYTTINTAKWPKSSSEGYWKRNHCHQTVISYVGLIMQLHCAVKKFWQRNLMCSVARHLNK